jgi:gas vesicle protein
MADRDGGSGFAIGLIVGAVLGLAVGFLFAPRPGEETRQLLKEKAGAARERAAEAARKVRETAGEAVKRARAKMEEA